MRIALPPRPRTTDPLAARPEPDGDAPDREALLIADASRVTLAPLELGEAVLEALLEGLLAMGVSSLEEARQALEEGPFWNKLLHPRWPKGTSLGGQWMEVGQRFRVGGVDYDVAAVMPGGIQAHVATKGKGVGAKTVEFTAKKLAGEEHPVIPDVERPPAEPINPGGSSGGIFKGSTGTVLDPSVYPETHDPSIPIPEGAPASLTSAKWARFGRLDQERYSQLMERYGSWSPGAAQTKVNQTLAETDSSAKSTMLQGYSSQYGSSSGKNLNYHNMYEGLKQLVGKANPTSEDQAKLEKVRDQYESTRALQAEAAGVLQWDLYNRIEAPDIALFHKDSAHGVNWWQQNITSGHEPVFGGLSQSQHWRQGFFGNITLATPMAIRHVVLSTISADLVTNHYDDEQEVATADLWVAGSQSVVFDLPQLNPSQKSWLTNVTKQAASGEVVERLRDAMEKGEIMPAPPQPAGIKMHGASGEGWKEPPPAAKIADSAGVMVSEMEYVDTTNGMPLSKPWGELGLQPGDYIEGNPAGASGTRYLILADPNDPQAGIAYYKLTEPDGTTPYTGTPTAWHFENPSNEFKKLNGHFDLKVSEPVKMQGFTKAAWTETKEQKQVYHLAAGTKFYVAGLPYELTAQPNPGSETVPIKSLADGNVGTINAGYQTPWLMLKPGYTEEGVPAFDPADWFSSPQGELGTKLAPGDVVKIAASVWQIKTGGSAGNYAVVQLHPSAGKEGEILKSTEGSKLVRKPLGWQPAKVGDTLAYEGKKAAVTKVLKSGDVQINLAPGVVKLKANDPALAGLFDLDGHEFGPKAKLKSLGEGQKFHGGTGTLHVRPFVVVEQKGKTTLVRNLDTGETMELSAGKSYPTLLPKQSPGVSPPEPGDHATPVDLTAVFDLSAWETTGHKKAVKDFQGGEHFLGSGGVPFEVTEVTAHPEGMVVSGPVFTVKNLVTGDTHVIPAGTADFEMLKPKAAGPAPPPISMPMKDMPEGTKFYKQGADGPDVYTVVSFTKLDGQGNHLAVKASAAEFVHATSEGGDDAYYPLSTTTAKSGYILWKPVPPGEPEPISGPTPITAAEMQVGDLIQHPKKHQGHVPAIWKVLEILDVGAEFSHVKAEIVTPSTSSEAKPAGYVGDITIGFGAEPWVKHGTQEPTPPSATAFDPDAYLEGEPTKLADLAVGDIFKGTKKGKHYLVTKTGAKSGLSALDLHTGKVSAPWDYTKVAPKMLPKATTAVDYADLKPGDPVQIGKLKPGDQFKAMGGIYALVQQGENSEAPAPVAAPVLEDGVSTGHAAEMMNASPLTLVTFHAKVGDVAFTLVAGDDPDSLPFAAEGGYSPKSKTGGGYHFTKAKHAPAGTLLQGKSGNTWKVKVAGPNPIVTGGHPGTEGFGQENLKLDGDLNLKIPSTAFVPPDGPPLQGPEVPVQTELEAEAELAGMGLPPGHNVVNLSGLPAIKELKPHIYESGNAAAPVGQLAPGYQVGTLDGGVFVVGETAVGKTTLRVLKIANSVPFSGVNLKQPGDTFWVSSEWVPSLSAGLAPEQPAGGSWFEVDQAKRPLTVGQLVVGDQFAMEDPTLSWSATQFPTVWEIVGPEPGGQGVSIKVIQSQLGTPGAVSGTAAGFEPSWVKKAAGPAIAPLKHDFDPKAAGLVGGDWSLAAKLKVGDVISNTGGDYSYAFWKVAETTPSIEVVALDGQGNEVGGSVKQLKVDFDVQVWRPEPSSDFNPADWVPGPVSKLSELTVGEKVQTTTGGKYEIAKASYSTGSIKSSGWDLKNFATGAIVSTNVDLPVKVLVKSPGAVALTALSEPKIGDPITPGEVKVGDHFIASGLDDAVYEVESVEPDPAMPQSVKLKTTIVKTGDPPAVGMTSKVGNSWTLSWSKTMTGWIKAAPPEPALIPLVSDEIQLQGYSQKAGHKGDYAPLPLSHLSIGAKFKDKTGTIYVVDHYGGSLTYFRHLTGPADVLHAAESKVRVKPI